MLDRSHALLLIEAIAVGAVLAAIATVLRRRGRAWALPPVAAVTAWAWALTDLIPVGAAAAATVVGLALVGLDRPPSVTAPVAMRRIVPIPDVDLTAFLAVISLAGVFLAVPDTEAPLVAAAVVALPVGAGSLVAGRWDRCVALALVVASAWVGGAGTPQLVGGLACVGLLADARPRTVATSLWTIRSWIVVVVHGAVVLVAARGLTRVGSGAAVLGAAAVVVVATVFGAVSGPSRDTEHP